MGHANDHGARRQRDVSGFSLSIRVALVAMFTVLRTSCTLIFPIAALAALQHVGHANGVQILGLLVASLVGIAGAAARRARSSGWPYIS